MLPKWGIKWELHNTEIKGILTDFRMIKGFSDISGTKK
jgi:hypothetical protein